MNILFAVSEAAPFAKTGGLADVSSALPKALKEASRISNVHQENGIRGYFQEIC